MANASRLRRIGLAMVVAVLALAGGIAYAAVQSGGSTVNACALKQGGQLRLDTGGGCLPSEQSVQWPASADSTVRNATGFIFEGTTASTPVLSGAGRLGTLSFTCGDVTYRTNTADTNTFDDRVMFYSPQVPTSPLAVTVNQDGAGDHLTVPWSSQPLNRWFQVMIEGATGSQTDVTLTTITGWVRAFPQFSGCSYFAYVQTSDVRSPQTFTP